MTLGRTPGIQLAICPQLLVESERLSFTPRRKVWIEPTDVERFVARLTEQGIVFEDPVDPTRDVPADPNDDYLIALAVESGAEYFVTR